ncbi:hypothetical protein AVEN_116775-1 [Araneus ventricosus]|uniref:Uncharacterized protein n=1 Tax=Araneus ventricosus TaxID=182803 RepID=A0A4Y2D6D0_ARAVE|nr:hypothetical protein AVEN_116775-1 [Araneus ventricosus]
MNCWGQRMIGCSLELHVDGRVKDRIRSEKLVERLFDFVKVLRVISIYCPTLLDHLACEKRACNTPHLRRGLLKQIFETQYLDSPLFL